MGVRLFKATYRLDVSGKLQIMSVSDGIESTLGFEPQEILSSAVSLIDRIHPDDKDISDRLFSIETPRDSNTFNIRLRHADGKIRCFRGSYKKRTTKSGKVILDLKLQDAKSLWKNPRRQHISGNCKAMLDNTDDFIFFKDRNHVFTAASQNITAALDSERQGINLLGHTDYDLFPEEYADIYYRLEKQVFAGQPVASATHESPLGSGRMAWLDNRKYPIHDRNGKIIGLFGISREITRRVHAEQALRDREVFLKEAQEIAGLGNYVLDVRTGAWTSCEVLDRIFGIDRSYEHNVAGWTNLIHPEDCARMTAYLEEEVIGKGHSFNQEYRIVRQSDQARRWVCGLGRLESDVIGQPLTMRGTIQDITDRKLSELKLMESQELLRLLIENAPVSLSMFDREMHYLAISRRCRDDFGLGDREVIGHSHYEILPWLPDRIKDMHQRAMAGETVRSENDRFEKEDGTVIWGRSEVLPWRAGDGSIGGVILFTEDITERKQTMERLNLAASVFAQTSEGIIITDSRGTILEVNEAFTRISGYSRHEAIGENPRMVKSGRQSAEFYKDMWREITQKGHWSGEVWNRAKNGQEYAERLTISALRDATGETERYIALFSDITSAKEQECKLQQISLYDTLTGLPNRANLTTRLHKAMANAHLSERPLAIALMDLDNFSAVNDRYGHGVGDDFLKAIAQRMKASLRERDILARLAGDKFAIVLPDVADTESSWQVLNRIQKAVSDPVQLGGLSLEVSVSLGVTYFPQTEPVGADQLLRQADQALFLAKQQGKGRYHVFDPGHDRSVRDLHESTERIRQGLINHEFVLYYQPKVNMSTGEVLGVEALIRWQHPERGLVPPGEFLPIIEGHPIAIEVGRWVIDTALTQSERWHADGLLMPISVNIAPEQLQQPDFAGYLSNVLAAHPTVPPSSFELEILESTKFEDATRVSEVIRSCKKLGVSFALDDFGTGYASLTYLRRLPVDVLKIDQTFIRDMLEDAEDLTILEGVLGLANTFRCKVVAEGVETVEHGLMLLRLGCQVAQGYAIARPMPACSLPAWVSSWHPDPQWKNVLQFVPENRPVLYAGVEHRAWVVSIEDFVNEKRQNAPLLDKELCRFGSWLSSDALVDGQVVAKRGGLGGFRCIDTLHQKLHATAARILTHKIEGRRREALAGFAELHILREELSEKLNNLVQS
jgi:diguanylate cyclase (GGDEF)-like protein/PAS domain S-box-containing protein